MKNLNQKKILLIICGGIAAYKSLDVIRILKKNGSKVKTILTKNAKSVKIIVFSYFPAFSQNRLKKKSDLDIFEI